MGYLHWGYPWGAKPKRPYKWQHGVDFYCGRYPNFFIAGLQDAKTSKVTAPAFAGSWDFYYNYWSCNILTGYKYIIQVSNTNNLVIYPYPETTSGGLNEKDFEMLQWHIDGIFHMYAGLYDKTREYRPVDVIWQRMVKAQAYMDEKETGFFENGRKPNWINKTNSYLRSWADPKYRMELD